MSAYLTKKQTARCRVENSDFDFPKEKKKKKKKKKLNLTHLNANSLITSSEFIKAE